MSRYEIAAIAAFVLMLVLVFFGWYWSAGLIAVLLGGIVIWSIGAINHGEPDDEF